MRSILSTHDPGRGSPAAADPHSVGALHAELCSMTNRGSPFGYGLGPPRTHLYTRNCTRLQSGWAIAEANGKRFVKMSSDGSGVDIFWYAYVLRQVMVGFAAFSYSQIIS